MILIAFESNTITYSRYVRFQWNRIEFETLSFIKAKLIYLKLFEYLKY